MSWSGVAVNPDAGKLHGPGKDPASEGKGLVRKAWSRGPRVRRAVHLRQTASWTAYTPAHTKSWLSCTGSPSRASSVPSSPDGARRPLPHASSDLRGPMTLLSAHPAFWPRPPTWMTLRRRRVRFDLQTRTQLHRAARSTDRRCAGGRARQARRLGPGAGPAGAPAGQGGRCAALIPDAPVCG